MSEIYRCGDWKYMINEDDRATLVEYLAPSYRVEIPYEVDSCIVNDIKGNLFHSVEEIIFPADSEIIIIPDNFCMEQHELKHVKLPDGIEVIGNQAFANCWKLSSVNVPNNLLIVGDYAFFATNIHTPVISDKTFSIGDAAFLKCAGMNCDIKLSNEILYIFNSAFKSSAIKSLDISECNHLYRILPWAFADCQALKTVILPEQPDEKLILENAAFHNCSGLKKVENSQNIAVMQNEVFLGTGLTSLKLENIESIGNHCFYKSANENIGITVYVPNRNAKTRTIWSKLEEEGVNIKPIYSQLKRAVYNKNVSKDRNDYDER